VLNNAGLIGGFERSVGLVRGHLSSAIGYTIVVATGSLVFGGLAGVGSILLSPRPTGLPVPELSPLVLAGAAFVSVLAMAILGAFYATYSVAFYRAIESPA
ncbi:MAG: hypothetical protein ACOCSF_07145, partial [Halanaeroarchaeum sp.]